MIRSTRALLAIGALAAMLPHGVPSVSAAALSTLDTPAGMSTGTAFDRVIDLIVARRMAAGKLTAADAVVIREQLAIQFESLTRAEQQKLVANTRSLGSEEAVEAASRMLGAAVKDEAERALADVQASARAQMATSQSRGLTKLGADGDLVFVATAGPCRVYDSRNGPGQLFGGASRQVYVWSDNAFYSWASDQGGTGTAGSGNCVGSFFGGAVEPASVVATITVLNTPTAGALRAWNGGTTLTTGSALAWETGARAANTTVVPINRNIALFPGSGSFKRDIGLNNNSPGSVDVVVDVVGYFIENRATALDCTLVVGPVYSLPAGTSVAYPPPACAAGYTFITAQPVTNVFGVNAGTLNDGICRISNTTGVAQSVNCGSRCCRVPGR